MQTRKQCIEMHFHTHVNTYLHTLINPLKRILSFLKIKKNQAGHMCLGCVFVWVCANGREWGRESIAMYVQEKCVVLSAHCELMHYPFFWYLSQHFPIVLFGHSSANNPSLTNCWKLCKGEHFSGFVFPFFPDILLFIFSNGFLFFYLLPLHLQRTPWLLLLSLLWLLVVARSFSHIVIKRSSRCVCVWVNIRENELCALFILALNEEPLCQGTAWHRFFRDYMEMDEHVFFCISEAWM